ncbi:hypothetical protein FQN54_003777 [Arachnomyces sp. PD_36]|nr:hypothetical protein FQN54_003777 [Arachnomyces sp. PD_36]
MKRGSIDMDTNMSDNTTEPTMPLQTEVPVPSELNGRRRKRRNSCISSPGEVTKRPSTRSLTRANTRTNAQISKDEDALQSIDAPESSRKPKKRVRFSDPGPTVRLDEGLSTGLTPAIRRTSLRGAEYTSRNAPNTQAHTPSRTQRRRSAPTPRSTRSPSRGSSSSPRPRTQEFQFPALRQQLDERTQRRIRRVGLSEEMNNIEQDKRGHMKHEKELLREKDLELAALKEELEAARSIKSEEEEVALQGNAYGNSTASRRIEELEAEVRQLRGEIATSGASQYNNDVPMSSYESTDTVLISDSNINDTILVSTTPDRQYGGDYNSAMIPSPSPTSCSPIPRSPGETPTPATPDSQKEAEIFALSLDLEAAKQEKLDLFNEWRSHISSGAIPSPNPSDVSRLSSPPPDFMAQVTTTLQAALSRASDATLALDILREDLSVLGFPGPSTDDIIAEMRSRFREARIELERAIPGETPNASLDNGNATLHALVERVKSLVQDVKDGQEKLAGSTDREKVLRGQFDACLARYEAAAKKIGELEETIESTADDMLHSRMRIQELEREGKDQAFGIERLNNAMEKYREETKELEVLITTLESEHNEATATSNQTIATLESKIKEEERARREAESLAEQHKESVKKLEHTLARNIHKIGIIRTERDELVEEIDRKTTEQAAAHDRQTGSLNAKIADLTTYLAEANSRLESLREANTRLRQRLSTEEDAFTCATEAIQAENAKAFARIKEMTNSSLRSVKVRKANAELEDAPTTPTTNAVGGNGRKRATFAPIGSEPMTPSSGGSRFVDVEVGRGNKRKKLDSGIGILEEEGEGECGREGDSGFGEVEMQ